MTKKTILILSLMIFFSIDCINAIQTEKNISVEVDGKALNMDVAPYIKNSRTMIPFRAIFEGLGAKVTYDFVDERKKIVVGEKLDTKVILTIGKDKAIVNKKEKPLDAPAELKNSRTFVPLRFVSESMGAKVDWDEKNRKVSIWTHDPQSTQSNIKNIMDVTSIPKELQPSYLNYPCYTYDRDVFGASYQVSNGVPVITLNNWDGKKQWAVDGIDAEGKIYRLSGVKNSFIPSDKAEGKDIVKLAVHNNEKIDIVPFKCHIGK